MRNEGAESWQTGANGAPVRNLRSVWSVPPPIVDGDVWRINTKGTKELHYATFPPKLAETMIRIGTSERGCCAVCGAPWERVSEKTGEITTGWRPICSHADVPTVPCTVLDPFSGAGTTVLVADQLGRNAIGIELKPEYHDLATNRLAGVTTPATQPVTASHEQFTAYAPPPQTNVQQRLF
jgi:hypothetical protein